MGPATDKHIILQFNTPANTIIIISTYLQGVGEGQFSLLSHLFVGHAVLFFPALLWVGDGGGGRMLVLYKTFI